MSARETLGDQLKRERTNRGYEIWQVAGMANLTQPQVENAERSMGQIETSRQLAGAYGMIIQVRGWKWKKLDTYAALARKIGPTFSESTVARTVAAIHTIQNCSGHEVLSLELCLAFHGPDATLVLIKA